VGQSFSISSTWLTVFDRIVGFSYYMRTSIWCTFNKGISIDRTIHLQIVLALHEFYIFYINYYYKL